MQLSSCTALNSVLLNGQFKFSGDEITAELTGWWQVRVCECACNCGATNLVNHIEMDMKWRLMRVIKKRTLKSQAELMTTLHATRTYR